jgi:GrpB-like predicted nucleotidyltransferase (UPF0157 family)
VSPHESALPARSSSGLTLSRQIKVRCARCRAVHRAEGVDAEGARRRHGGFGHRLLHALAGSDTMGRMSDDPLLDRLREVVIGDLGPVHVELVEHDPAWLQRFSSHAQRIRAALGEAARRVEHIGSTAVPGLAAKPIIDILLVVDDPADEASYLPELKVAGYELRVREADFDEHRMLRTPTRDVHIHVFPPWSSEIDRYLTLREHLRASPPARAAYETRKRELANREWPTMDHYARAKSTFIEVLIAEAGGSAPGS